MNTTTVYLLVKVHVIPGKHLEILRKFTLSQEGREPFPFTMAGEGSQSTQFRADLHTRIEQVAA